MQVFVSEPTDATTDGEDGDGDGGEIPISMRRVLPPREASTGQSAGGL